MTQKKRYNIRDYRRKVLILVCREFVMHSPPLLGKLKFFFLYFFII